jgi:hypothetical protein
MPVFPGEIISSDGLILSGPTNIIVITIRSLAVALFQNMIASTQPSYVGARCIVPHSCQDKEKLQKRSESENVKLLDKTSTGSLP